LPASSWTSSHCDDPGAGVEDVHARGAERQAEFGLQHLGDAGAHEIDDGLRRVEDAVRVGDLDRIALEEALVDRV